MTVLVSIKINDGVVMAADSASSFASGMVYQHADKIVNLRHGLPIGAMVTGAGGIGNESIDTLLKDLRRRFNGEDEGLRDWALDPARYTLSEVANRIRTFLFEEKAAAYAGEVWTRLRLCGYSADRPLAEVWEVLLLGPNSPAPTQVQGEQDFGIRWDGEYEALSRLIFGLGTGFEDAAAAGGLTPEAARDLHARTLAGAFRASLCRGHADPRRGRPGAFSRRNDDQLCEVLDRPAQNRRRPDRDRRHHQARGLPVGAAAGRVRRLLSPRCSG